MNNYNKKKRANLSAHPLNGTMLFVLFMNLKKEQLVYAISASSNMN